MSDLKIQGEVVVSTEGAENSLNRVGSIAEGMARKVENSASQAGKAVDSIGAGAGESAEKFTRAEGRIVDSIKRATTQLELLGKTASQKLEFKISTQGLDVSKFEPALAKLRELEAAQARIGAGSKGMGGALQNTSYQLQDFITQVNGGADATKALGQQLPQMLVGFGAAGAAVGVLAALLPNLVAAFSSTATGAKNFKDAMSDFDKAIGDVGQATKTFDMDNLYEEFNKSSAAVRAATIEQLKFQQEYIRTTQLVSQKKFGESLGGLGNYGTFDKLVGAFASSGSERLAKDLGIATDVAKDLLPVLSGLKNGSEDVSLAFNKFGTVLLGGNQKAVDLATSMATLSKSERDAAAASSALSEAQEKMAKGHVQTKKEAEAAAKANKDAAKSAEELAKLLDSINGKDSGFDSGYVQNVEMLLKAYDKGKLSLSEFNAVFARYVAMQPGAVAAAKELAKAEQEAEKTRQDYMRGLGDETAKLLEKAKASEFELAAIGLSADGLAALTAQRYDEQIALKEGEAERLRGVQGRESEVFLIEQQIAALQRLKDAEVTKPKLQAQAKAWDNFARDIEQSLTDSLYRAFESGQSFGEAFANSLKNTFKTMVLKVAVQAVIGGGASLTNAGLNALLGTSGSNGGAGNNYLGMANNASSLYNLWGAAAALGGGTVGASSASLLYANAVGAVGGDSLGALIAANGGWSGVSTAAAGSTAAGGAGAGTGSAAGAAASMWPLAVVAGMYMSSKLYDSGYKFENDTVKANDPKTWSLLAQAGMYNEANMVGKLFGQDNFGDSKIWQVLSGANLSRYVDEYVQKALGIRGGGPKMEAFGGDRAVSWGLAQTAPGNEVLSGIATGLETQFNSILETFGKSAQDIMVGLGMDADPNGDAGARTGYALKVGDQSIFSERGVDSLTMEAIQNNANRALIAALQAVDISQPVNAYLDSLGDIGKLTKDQISTALGMIDTYHGLNKAMADLNLGADSLTTGLLNAFGGVQGLQTALASYYENYFTAEEKRARAVSQITTALDAAGATFTDAQIGSMDRADYRAWVESIDQTTAAGQSLFTAALQVSAAFAAITDSADQAAASLKQSAADIAASAIAAAQKNIDALRTVDTSGLDAAMSAVERAIDAEKTAAQVQLDAASERAAAIGQLTDVLKQSIDDIYGTATSTAASQVAKAQAFIDRSLQTASRTGYLPDADALSQAIKAVRSSQTADAYASNFEFQRAQLVLAGQLGGLQDIAKPQLSAAEHAVQLAQDQLDALDQQLKAAQDQVDALRGIDTSVVSVAAAVAGLQTALATEQAARDIATATPETATIRDQVSALYDIMLNRQADQTGLDYWTSQATAAGSLALIIDLFRQAAITNGEVPAFASGTAFVPRDMRADIHQGEIIIDPASSNVLRRYGIGVSGAGDGSTAKEITALREEQRAQAAAVAGFMARFTKVVEKWDAEGMPEVAV